MGYREHCERWLRAASVDEETKREIMALSGDEAALEDRFSAMMTFGTAGLRGKMRAGLNGMNVYTVRYATQGLAELIKRCGEEVGGGVTIAYDCRHNSRLFAEEAASVLAANGIPVNLFDDLRPTPELSYAVRETSSIAGINITASHNTKEYNGYKAYWSDGGQLPPEHADEVANAMAALDLFRDVRTMPFEEALDEGWITILGSEIDEKYMAEVLAQSVGREFVEQVGERFSLVFTPFHGAGHRLVPEVLHRLGVKKVLPVQEQMRPDGAFPTVTSPNPENIEGFRLAIALAEKEDADLIIGTDPDSDRCGVLAKKGKQYEALSGNQIGSLLLDYLITVRRAAGTLPPDAAAIKSIVSTGLFSKICRSNGVTPFEVLTGFKFVGEKIKALEEQKEHTFLFGFEESIGFLAGSYTRDKDAVCAAMLVAEMGCYYKAKGMTLWEGLEQLFLRYGYYLEETTSVRFEGHRAEEEMGASMELLRRQAPQALGLPVVRVRDYREGTIRDLRHGKVEPTGLAKSNVLFYELADACAVAVRPSGTEPKVKLYVLINGSTREEAEARLCLVREASLALLGGMRKGEGA